MELRVEGKHPETHSRYTGQCEPTTPTLSYHTAAYTPERLLLPSLYLIVFARLVFELVVAIGGLKRPIAILRRVIVLDQ
jgi:hypothetical protein